MSDWALAIELDSQRDQAQSRTNGAHPRGLNGENMRRLTVTLNSSNPPSRQLLTVVRCCQCGHQSGLPTDYSTPYQCLGYSGYYSNYSSTSATSGTDSSSPAVSSAEGSPPSTATSGTDQRVACRHVYCLGCQWLVNGEFRVLHPIEIRDETDYSAYAYGYGSQYGQQVETQQSSSSSSRRGRGHGVRRNGG